MVITARHWDFRERDSHPFRRSCQQLSNLYWQKRQSTDNKNAKITICSTIITSEKGSLTTPKVRRHTLAMKCAANYVSKVSQSVMKCTCPVLLFLLFLGSIENSVTTLKLLQMDIGESLVWELAWVFISQILLSLDWIRQQKINTEAKTSSAFSELSQL